MWRLNVTANCVTDKEGFKENLQAAKQANNNNNKKKNPKDQTEPKGF